MKKKLIEAEEAKWLISKESYFDRVETIPVQAAIGKFLAEPIVSSMDLPPFNSSAMDGFAIQYQEQLEYPIVGESSAGSQDIHPVNQPYGACRIFTGAPVPQWADTVIMQEWAEWDYEKVVFQQLPPFGSNIRKKGSHVQNGQLLFEKETFINGAVAATISGIGKEKITVFHPPKVTALVTGNEVILPGSLTSSGQIYDSNVPLILDFGQKIGLPISLEFAMDREEIIREKIQISLKNSDVIIATGGVSVGDYDFIPLVLKDLGFEIIFHGVAQKPGKPLLFAKKNGKFFWGLPGNPISVAHCLWMFVFDFFQRKPLVHALLPSKSNLTRKTGLTQFYRAKVRDGGVEIIKNSDSHHIYSMSEANAIVEIPALNSEISSGDLVKTWILP